jgi:hypothetical protein
MISKLCLEIQKMEFIRPKDTEVVRAIFDAQGAIFGGYLRDVIAGVEPSDIDVTIFEVYKGQLWNDLLKLGYLRMEFNPDNETWKWVKPGALPIEVYVNEYDQPGDVILGPMAAPDFDVNLLETSNGVELFNWMNPDEPIDDILAHIRHREAIMMTSEGIVGQDRIDKILKKGYRIIGNSGPLRPELSGL